MNFEQLLDVATKGTWQTHASHVFAFGRKGGNVCSAGEPRASSTVGYTPVSIGSKDLHEAHANAQYIARVSPTVMREVWAALREGRAYVLEHGSDKDMAPVIEKFDRALALLDGQTEKGGAE